MKQRFQAHSGIGRFFASPLMLFVFLIILGVVGNATWNIFKKERITNDRIEIIQNEVDSFEERKIFLEKELAELETPEGQERALREQFGVARAGEQVLVLVEDGDTVTGSNLEDRTFWDAVKEFFR